MNYEVAFDISHKAYDWSSTLLGLFFVAVGFLAWKYPAWRNGFRIHPVVFIVFGLVVAFGTFTFQFANHQAYAQILRQGHAKVVVGYINNFEPMPKTGHGDEAFTVNNIPFSYSDFEVTPAFNNTSSHGGPLREGLFVRLFYTDSREFSGKHAILRIEIER